MEALEFLRNYDRMCSTIDKCSECPAVNMKCCELYTDEQAKLVEIVEKWAKAHPEEATDSTKQKQDEPCVKTIQDNIEGAIYRSIALNKARIENIEYEVSVIRHDLEVLDDRIYDLREKVYHTQTKEASQPPEPKRTNKDVLLAAFPNAFIGNDGIPYACPYRLDTHYNCDKFENCLRCRHTHWLSEAHGGQ